jgi:hypothetical protein
MTDSVDSEEIMNRLDKGESTWSIVEDLLIEGSMRQPTDLDLKSIGLKAVTVLVFYFSLGLPGVLGSVYLFVGDSLARRTGQRQEKHAWLITALFWPGLLLLDAAQSTKGDAS